MSLFRPGDLVKEYAGRKGWKLKRRNLMLEGDSDVNYFRLAARRYNEKKGLNIIGRDFDIFSAGTGDSGGTRGLLEEFPPLRHIIQTDLDQNGKSAFRVVALVDNDKAGRSCHKSLLQQYRSLQNNRDIFLLHYVFPRTTSEPKALASQLAKHNAEWRCLDCEIEDLLGQNIISTFLEEEPNALIRKEAAGKRCHYEWAPWAKGRLYQYAKTHSILEDLAHLVGVLKAFRFYLGLPPDGI